MGQSIPIEPIEHEMIRLSRLLSITDLKRRRRRARGQIATLLMLVLIGVLTFAVAAANLGVHANVSLTVANAADAAALTLGSDLASKSHLLNEQLKTAKGRYSPGAAFSGKAPKSCVKKAGFGLLIVTFIVAVAAIIVTAGAATSFTVPAIMAYLKTFTGMLVAMGVGAAAGASSGAMFGAATGTGALAGASQGATVGAAAGAGMAVGAQAGTWIGGAIAKGSSAYGTLSGAVAAGDMFAADAAAGLLTAGYQTGAAVGAGVVAGGSLGTELFVDSVETIRQGDQMAAIARRLNGLDEKERFREKAMLEAFSRTVDDPTTVKDANDVDADGDREEQISRFTFRWDERITALKKKNDEVASRVGDLLERFVVEGLDTFVQESGSLAQEWLSRKEVEGEQVVDEDRGGARDGKLVELVRALEDPAARGRSANPDVYPVSFWDAGPSGWELATWLNSEDQEAPPPPGYDSLDHVILALQEFSQLLDGRDEELEGLARMSRAARYATRDLWATSSVEYYREVLTGLLEGERGETPDDPPLVGLKQWREEIEEIRDTRLPACQELYDEESGDVIGAGNAPCKFPDGSATSDMDLDDEFRTALQGMGELIRVIETFRDRLNEFEAQLEGTDVPLETLLSDINPTTYAWEDSRGKHAVTVEVSQFKMPTTKRKKSSSFLKTTICIVLKDYEDATGKNTWVRITRRDPSQRFGVWTWNPGGGTVTKVSRIRYSFDRVGVTAITLPGGLGVGPSDPPCCSTTVHSP
jgi:hypothetical protein